MRRFPGGIWHSLRMRVILLLCLFALILHAVIAFVWMPRMERILRETTVEYAQNQINNLGGSIVPYLLSNELSGIYQTFNDLLSHERAWRGLQLSTPAGRKIYPLGDAPTPDGPDVVTLASAVTYQGKRLAVLTAQIDLSEDLARLDREGRTLTVAITVIFLALLVGVSLLLDRWLTRPILQLSRAVEELRKGDFEAALPASRLSDIQGLTQGFDEMRRDILTKERNLEEARKTAETAAGVKARILAVMSHEIRTPLNGILGMLELLDGTTLTPEQRRYEIQIRELGQNLLGQINDVLAIAHFEAIGGEPSYQALDINQLVGNIAFNLETLAGERGNRLVFDRCPDAQARVMTDGVFIRHIVQNLLSNAIKFTKGGIIAVRIDTTARPGRLLIRVKDSGSGIAPENLERIFEDFVSISPDPEKFYQGTGLGLGIVRRLAERLDGTVRVESRPGQGTTFTVDLPYRAAEQPAAEVQAPPQQDVEPILAGILSQRGPDRPVVLVVEDNEINMLVISKMLKTLGFEVDEAKNGLEGLERARTRAYFLIISDLQMPRMGGREMMAQIRAARTSPNAGTPAIAISANLWPEEEARDRDGLFEGATLKPINRDNLVRCILGALGARGPAADPAPPAPAPEEALVNPGQLQMLEQQFGAAIVRESLDHLSATMERLKRVLEGPQPGILSADLIAAVHGEISSTIHLGFPGLTTQLRHLETSARTEGEAAVSRHLRALLSVWAATRAAASLDERAA